MAPLREMQAKHVNMQDIRTELGIKSLDSKIEKRVLERIGHIMRMEDDRLVKAATLGWIEELENIDKVPGRKNNKRDLVQQDTWTFPNLVMNMYFRAVISFAKIKIKVISGMLISGTKSVTV